MSVSQELHDLLTKLQSTTDGRLHEEIEVLLWICKIEPTYGEIQMKKLVTRDTCTNCEEIHLVYTFVIEYEFDTNLCALCMEEALKAIKDEENEQFPGERDH